MGTSSKNSSPAKKFLEQLGPAEAKVLLSLASHPGWMSLAFLQSASGASESEVASALLKLEASKHILKSEQEPYYWQWSAPNLSEALREYFPPEDFVDVHRGLFGYIQSLPDSPSFLEMLLFHAVRGGLAVPAFRYSLLLAEAYLGEGAAAEALELLDQAQSFADTDFKRAYLQNEIAGLLFKMGRYPEAAERWSQALETARSIPWAPLERTCALSLANLDSHQGRFGEAEIYYRRSLGILASDIDPKSKRQILQNLAASLIEQGRYNEAIELLESLDSDPDLTPFERVAIGMHRVRIDTALGSFAKAKDRLGAVESLLQVPELAYLKPYLDFLKARFELAQGRFVESFRYFEEAARGFEADEDLAGKVDVLLALSSVLLENSLLLEAHQLVGEISRWEGLARYPALEQAIRLRRLTLAAFSGRWVEEDIGLLKPEAEKAGRQEDWLQFWFHLGLAALRIDNADLADRFFSRAKAILDRITLRLSEEQRRGFRQRPEISRLFRLLEKDERPLSETQAVRADQASLDFDEAPEASLAPPRPNRPR